MRDHTEDCQNCGKEVGFDSDKLPDSACDTEEIECENCGCILHIGWQAIPEVRKFEMPEEGGAS